MPSDKKYRVEITWGVTPGDVKTIEEWEIYASPQASTDIKGDLIAKVDGAERKAVVTVPQGNWYFRVIAVNERGEEISNWQKTPVSTWIRVDGSAIAAPAASPSSSETNIASSKPSGVAVSVATEDADEENVESYELVEGPDEFRGQKVSDIRAERESFLGGGRQHTVTDPAFNQTGYNRSRDVYIVKRGPGGDTKGPGIGITGIYVHPRDDAEEIVLASLEATGSTVENTNFPTPGSTDEYEHDNTDGIRALEVPLADPATMDPDWGDSQSGKLFDVASFCQYLPKIEIETSEANAGQLVRGRLDIFDQFQRKSSDMPDLPAAFFKLPSWPRAKPDFFTKPLGPEWFGEYVRSDGKPCHPLERTRWYVKWGTSTPISMSYVPYVPAMEVVGQYFQAKLVAEDPLGLWQLICPYAHFKIVMDRRRFVKEDVWPTSTSTINVTLTNDPIMAATPFPTQMAYFATALHSTLDILITVQSVAYPTVTLRAIDVATGNAPTSSFRYSFMAVGY